MKPHRSKKITVLHEFDSIASIESENWKMKCLPEKNQSVIGSFAGKCSYVAALSIRLFLLQWGLKAEKCKYWG
ncbi:unnamed protein product [Cochlearia groenlandica]